MKESIKTFLGDVAPNGEITYDSIKEEYTVWDESYAYVVCVTNYPLVAVAALKAYAEDYLEENNGDS